VEAVTGKLPPFAKRRDSQAVRARGRVLDWSAGVASRYDARDAHFLGSDEALLDDPRWIAPAKAHVHHVDAVLDAVVERGTQGH
jgi:hypothetical protein